MALLDDLYALRRHRCHGSFRLPGVVTAIGRDRNSSAPDTRANLLAQLGRALERIQRAGAAVRRDNELARALEANAAAR